MFSHPLIATNIKLIVAVGEQRGGLEGSTVLPGTHVVHEGPASCVQARPLTASAASSLHKAHFSCMTLPSWSANMISEMVLMNLQLDAGCCGGAAAYLRGRRG